MEIEKVLVDRGLRHEIVSVFKVLDLVELRLHKIVNRFDIGLHAMRSRVDGLMALSREQLDGSGVSRGFFGVPGTDIFAAVVGLAA